MLALTSRAESSTVVTVAQLEPTAVTSPTTSPWAVMATMSSAMPEPEPLLMVKELVQSLESQVMM